MFALAVFTVRAIYRHAVETVRWTVPSVITSCRIKKNQAEAWFLMFALPIFTASHPATIVGVHELNFCVRDGNRWTLMTINTNSYGWVLPIFYIKILYRILIPFLVTRTGFEPMLKA